MEECDELSQRISKALIFGMHEVQVHKHQNPHGLDNLERIYQEYMDLRAVLRMAGIEVLDSSVAAQEAERAKVQRVEGYLLYSKKCGTLEVDF